MSVGERGEQLSLDSGKSKARQRYKIQLQPIMKKPRENNRYITENLKTVPLSLTAEKLNPDIHSHHGNCCNRFPSQNKTRII